MPTERTPKDPFAKAEAGLAKAMDGWSRLAIQNVEAQGIAAVGGVIAKLKKFLGKLVKSLFGAIRKVFEQLDPFGTAQALGSFVAAGVEDLIDDINDLIKDILDAPGAITDAAIAAVLGLIEAVKKTIHLILDGIKNPVLTQPVEIFLDLIDNVLGNIAELISPAAGKTAHRFRTNMYGQLYAIRRADAARFGRFSPSDELREVD